MTSLFPGPATVVYLCCCVCLGFAEKASLMQSLRTSRRTFCVKIFHFIDGGGEMGILPKMEESFLHTFGHGGGGLKQIPNTKDY